MVEDVGRQALADPKLLAKIATAIAEAVGDQGFELSPPQSLYVALRATEVIAAQQGSGSCGYSVSIRRYDDI